MKVFIIGAVRTPIGKMGGSLSSVSVVELGSIVIREALRRSNIGTNQVDRVIMGCVLQAGQGQNVARQSSLKAGIPFDIPAETVNVVCGSGLEAINLGAKLIKTGDAEIVVAGGMESMSNAPFALLNARFGYKMGSPMINTPIVDTMVNDGLWDSINNYHMGITAENVAKQWNLTREELDLFAAESQQKAVSAIEGNSFADEIVPITIKTKKGNVVVCSDEAPRKDSSVESLSQLKPAFQQDGVITAGNCSGINDGAAAVVLVSEKKVKELGLVPQAEWIASSLVGVDPSIMGTGPIASTQKLLKSLNMTIDDIDYVEANEAFSSQSIVVRDELGIPKEKININGGAIALGHPIGASGCRILVTLIYILLKNKASTGLATLCIGGGMGCSTIIRRFKDVTKE